MSKPIRIFFSPLSRRIYATRAYKEIKPGVVEVTGEKFDVTEDLRLIVHQNNLVFVPIAEATK